MDARRRLFPGADWGPAGDAGFYRLSLFAIMLLLACFAILKGLHSEPRLSDLVPFRHERGRNRIGDALTRTAQSPIVFHQTKMMTG